MNKMVSWLHFGDLHIDYREQQNYSHFQALVDEAGCYLTPGIDFALLPGDNADNGTADESALVREALARFPLPLHAIAGDHDRAGGNLDLFQEYLSPSLYQSFRMRVYHFVLLNSLAVWNPPRFGLGPEQLSWLRQELAGAAARKSQSVLFMHAYPSEHGADADALRALIADHEVLLVEMGHTHYNELANDGHTLYAATRSTGQIEEGPPGFSVTTLDDSVVSWKFKQLGEWPLVMITSPGDNRLIVDPAHPAQVVRGKVEVRARVWGDAIQSVGLSIDSAAEHEMTRGTEGLWSCGWDSACVPDGLLALTVRAKSDNGQWAEDTIHALVSQDGLYAAPPRKPGDAENAIGAWQEKHIPGTQLGPNKNGRGWPSRRHAREQVPESVR